MKKSIYLLSAILMLLIINLSVIIAQTEIPIQESTEIIKSATGIKAPADVSGFKDSTNKFLETELNLPPIVKEIADILFKLEGRPVATQNLIILIALWIILFLLIQAILEVMPFFGEGWKSWSASAIITALISITGAIQTGAIWIFDLKTTFAKLGNYGFFFLILNIIFLAFFIWGARYLIKIIGNKIKVASSEQREFEQGLNI